MSDIIGVFSTKGGTGKTTLALNLAIVMKGYGSTLLVELDTNYSLSSILKMEATKFADVIEIDKKPTKYMGIALITSDGRTAKYEKNPTREQIKKIFSAGADYKYVVFDFHNYPSPLVVALLKRAKITLIPTVPTMAGLGAYIHSIKILEQLGAPYLGVMNMVHKGLWGVPKEEMTIINIARSKGKMWEKYLPFDRKVVIAEAKHKPAVAEFPNSHFSRSIKDLAKEVMNYAHNRY